MNSILPPLNLLPLAGTPPPSNQGPPGPPGPEGLPGPAGSQGPPGPSAISEAYMGYSTTTQSNPAVGQYLVFGNYTTIVPCSYIQLNGNPYSLTFVSGGSVSFLLTASIGNEFDGTIAYQWWDTTNNVGLGNIASNGGIATAVLPSTYSSSNINIGVQIVYVNGTTYIGGGLGTSFVGSWSTVVTIGAPQ
jgi:hypothetical protein